MPIVRLPVVHEMLGRIYTDAEWEALCNGCGDCCYETRSTDTGWVRTSIPCKYLDDFTKQCGVYSNRFQAQEDCIRVLPSVVLSGLLPAHCSYHDEVQRIIEADYEGDDPRDRQSRRRKRRGSRRRKP